MSDYFNVTTNNGDAAIATAIANNTKLNITHIAFGDGNGAVPTPNKARTTLVNEVYRQVIAKYEPHPTIANYLIVEVEVPSEIGGFYIREIGLIADGILISHGSHAPFFKVAEPDGVSEFHLKYTINIQDGGIVDLTLDESLIYATEAWVDENYVPRDEIVDNLTTDDAAKPVSAKQAKNLQDNKLDKNKRGAVSGVASLDENRKVLIDELPVASELLKGILTLTNNLTTDNPGSALTAAAGRALFVMFDSSLSSQGFQKIANPNNDSKPLIIQWGNCADNSGTVMNHTLPIAFPNSFFGVIISQRGTTVTPRPFAASPVSNSAFSFFTTSGSPLGSHFIAIGN